MSPILSSRTYIAADELMTQRDDSWVVIDARCDLKDPRGGHLAYAQGHIPGAVFADLNTQLSGRHQPGTTGRRPLPNPATLAASLRTLGVSSRSRVVVYDDTSGRTAAARLWVLLRWLGHEQVAVLEGGFRSWVRLGLPTATDDVTTDPGDLEPRIDPKWVARSSDVIAAMSDPSSVLIDARPTDVYAGSALSFDKVAGHIPGARCLPSDALERADGTLVPNESLRQRFSSLGALDPSVKTRIAYCGSGVWAAQHVLIMTHIGIPHARLYVGSFSEWLLDSNRPTQTTRMSGLATPTPQTG